MVLALVTIGLLVLIAVIRCPPDEHSELVVIDYLTGAFLVASIRSPIG